MSVVGPILPDLAKRTENSLTEYGVVFVSRAIGNVAGAFLSMLVVNSIEYMVRALDSRLTLQKAENAGIRPLSMKIAD